MAPAGNFLSLIGSALLGIAALLGTQPLRAHTALEAQLAELNRQIRLAPLDGELYFRRAELERSLRSWEAARADYDRAGRLSPGLAGLDLARGTMWLEARQPRRALPPLERFTAAHPEHPLGHLMTGRALARLRRWPAAVAAYDRALRLMAQPQPEFFLERAEAQAARGPALIPDALAGLDAGLARLGGAASLQLRAIELELRRDHHDDALARLDRLAAASPRPEIWHGRRGEMLERAGRLPEARAEYQAALAASEAATGSKREAARWRKKLARLPRQTARKA